MKKYFLVFLILTVLYSYNLKAEDSLEELNEFGFPDKSFVAEIKDNQAPREYSKKVDLDCNDSRLLQQLRATLEPYINQKTNLSAMSRRKAFLTIKNLKNFYELNPKDINYREDTFAADRVVELKINHNLSEESIKICKAANRFIGNNLYLVMYHTEKGIKVEAINFIMNKAPTFYLAADSNK